MRPPLPWTTPWSGTISLIAVTPVGLFRVGSESGSWVRVSSCSGRVSGWPLVGVEGLSEIREPCEGSVCFAVLLPETFELFMIDYVILCFN
ncbi:hypothetical protein C1H46_016995 [Malus baccata]|uniref:Secreted protein n=1 Tax=Malus baccata TaxID=106549 RepID=A0A540MF94_MALBA|nr:hypothetical protein C1H46_016995 [Malus baccata]